MKRYKRDWEGDITPNFSMLWLWFVLRPIAPRLVVARYADDLHIFV